MDWPGTPCDCCVSSVNNVSSAEEKISSVEGVGSCGCRMRVVRRSVWGILTVPSRGLRGNATEVVLCNVGRRMSSPMTMSGKCWQITPRFPLT